MHIKSGVGCFGLLVATVHRLIRCLPFHWNQGNWFRNKPRALRFTLTRDESLSLKQLTEPLFSYKSMHDQGGATTDVPRLATAVVTTNNPLETKNWEGNWIPRAETRQHQCRDIHKTASDKLQQLPKHASTYIYMEISTLCREISPPVLRLQGTLSPLRRWCRTPIKTQFMRFIQSPFRRRRRRH